MTAFWRSLGDQVSRLDHTEPLLIRSPPGDPHDTTTPKAIAGVLRQLVLGDVLSKSSRELFTRWLTDCKTGDHRLRAGLPKKWRIGNKTGNNGKDAAGYIGVAWSPEPILVCVYTQGGHPTSQQLDSVFKTIGEMVGREL